MISGDVQVGADSEMLQRLVIFGGAGDLTRRYLLPALSRLQAAGRLPSGFEIVAADRDDIATNAYREAAAGWLAQHAPTVASTARHDLARMLVYRQADALDPGSVHETLQPDLGPTAVYLALPPSVFGPAIAALTSAGLPSGSRLGIEKPFGTSLAHARELNRLVRRCLPEDAVFRIDHFLGMQMVQNLVGLRFANRVLEPVWNCHHVDAVEIVWDETLTLEGRGYYDAVGALRDMVQNHLLQLLALVGMEPPARLDARGLRDRKTDLLRAVRRFSPEEVDRHTVRARYTAGSVRGRQVPAYLDEEGVDRDRDTETFVQVTLRVDNWRWAGVPFVLRTGKALATDRREITIRFRPVPLPALAGAAPPNLLRIPLDPESLSLDLNLNAAGERFGFERVSLAQPMAPPRLPAYGWVLLALLGGDPMLSIRADEAEESWAIIEPILDAWAAGVAPLSSYAAGSHGPGQP
ncbi:MAG TPA: glucose-6-phosphate dehydrogenase [Nitriliruptorales bacterium]|nr:glucose-6-phosphate dehydrogenase [Nitriliruptorales bacterium]